VNKYDAVPYPLLSHSQTHPNALATLALLHGLKAPPVDHCRVLEVGCAGGGNLIPMACGLPESQFVGVDYSARQIEEGRGFVERLGLPNIRLENLNLLDFDPARFGQFDYIIAHGFYSWVPQPVREKLLDVCRHCLAPNGVAYVSFNAYPGWKSLSAVRDVLLYRTRGVDDLPAKASLAREMLNFLVEFLGKAKNVSASVAYAHAEFLQHVADKLKAGEDSYLVHDILEDTNDPFYFHEFAAQAAACDLQFLADTDFRAALASNLPAPVAQTIGDLSDNRIEWEQYTDFLSNRLFRQTLLCRAGVPVHFTVNAEALRAFRYACPAKPEGEADVAAPTVQKFTGIDGAAFATDHPVSKAAFHHLINLWPRTATFDDLLAAAYKRLGSSPADAQAAETDATTLASSLLKAFTYSVRLIEFNLHEPRMCLEVGEKPVASAWARLQAERGSTVTTLRHERYALEPLEQFVIQRLDGRQDCDMIVAALVDGPVSHGELAAQIDGQAVTDPEKVRPVLKQSVERTLRLFAHAPLLIS
jgi:methyltransferase-like protein/trans-aconitate methyltransferase